MGKIRNWFLRLCPKIKNDKFFARGSGSLRGVRDSAFHLVVANSDRENTYSCYDLTDKSSLIASLGNEGRRKGICNSFYGSKLMNFRI